MMLTSWLGIRACAAVQVCKPTCWLKHPLISLLTVLHTQAAGVCAVVYAVVCAVVGDIAGVNTSMVHAYPSV